MSRYGVCVVALAGVVLVAGCTSSGSGAAGPTRTPSPTSTAPPRTAMPALDTTVLAGTEPGDLAVATSRALFNHAPAVVLVASDDEGALVSASATAVQLGVPLLLTPSSPGPGTTVPTTPVAGTSMSATPGPSASSDATTALSAELSRLAPATVVAVDDGATRWARGAVPSLTSTTPTIVAVTGDSLPAVTPATPLDGLLVLALDRPTSRAAVATARASGARVLLMGDPDPRASDDVITALSSQSTTHVLAVGTAFGPPEQLRNRIDTAATGVRLPGGRQLLFPGRRMVALYGHPGDHILGSLGEQPLSAAIARARSVAASYSSLVREPVVPTFEIIATVASSSAGSDGNYSNESSVAQLQPWVDAAAKAGIYVVLDLQPGRTDFLTQAKLYAPLLAQPNVGLALDPEWRLKPGQFHMVQIGSVTAEEINKTAAWLADLTHEHHLPQKILLLHQFRLDMIANRDRLDTSHDELRVIIHADGFGTAGQKLDTWHAMQLNPPANVVWGWKNFYDEDKPTFTPRQTIAVAPSPVFVSYQ